jgi:hypothetical protein
MSSLSQQAESFGARPLFCAGHLSVGNNLMEARNDLHFSPKSL